MGSVFCAAEQSASPLHSYFCALQECHLSHFKKTWPATQFRSKTVYFAGDRAGIRRTKKKRTWNENSWETRSKKRKKEDIDLQSTFNKQVFNWLRYRLLWCWHTLIESHDTSFPEEYLQRLSQCADVSSASWSYPRCDGISVQRLRLWEQTSKWRRVMLESYAAVIMAGLLPPTPSFGQPGCYQISLWSNMLSMSEPHSCAHFLVSRPASGNESQPGYTEFILKA